jgi:MFS family permease
MAGLAVTPFAVAQLVFAPLSSTMVRRFGPRTVSAAGLALVTIALAGIATLGRDTPMWIVCILFFIQGTGMANTVPPSTESIMASVPRDRAGVGSAVQNTVRQVGGSVGIAVLGSIVATVFRRQISDTAAALPASARPTATSSISGAYGVAGHIGPLGSRLIGAANDAFVVAMHWAAAAGALVALGGVAVVLAWAPRYSITHPAPATVDTEPKRAAAFGPRSANGRIGSR